MEKKIAMLSIDVEEDVRGDDRKTYRGVERLDLFLDLLNRRHIRATMFVTGEALVRYPQKIQAWSKD
ncbi:MAG: hypothetical protein JW884_14555, partial [Deltaproteobacteria bacterium]|nr:hypothetical protein [Deltaproteobacteria bacterium]